MLTENETTAGTGTVTNESLNEGHRKPNRRQRLHNKARLIRRHWQLYLLVLPPLAFLLIFHYEPILGAQIAFRNYSPTKGIWGSPWIGLQEFRSWVENPDFWPVMRNTLTIGVYSLVVATPCTIILALAINEVRSRRVKKFVQTVTFFPYFISVVVLIGILQLVLSPNLGLVAEIARFLGFHSIPNVIASPTDFASLYVWSGVWQTSGYGAIIYLGVLTSVDPQLYEAANIDGASILQKIRHVDLPAILPTAIVLLILSLGSVLTVGFEKVYLLQNSLNLSTSQVVSTYVYEAGLTQGAFSFGTAVGLFNSIISLILVVLVNRAAKRFAGTSLY